VARKAPRPPGTNAGAPGGPPCREPRRAKGGYPIVGYDAGMCTLTRIPERFAEQTLANCVVTAVWTNGSLTVQGVVRFTSQQPQSAVLAVTGGTGRFDRAAGSVDLSFTKNFKVLSFALKSCARPRWPESTVPGRRAFSL
jgi:hypothetical protein